MKTPLNYNIFKHRVIFCSNLFVLGMFYLREHFILFVFFSQGVFIEKLQGGRLAGSQNCHAT